mmetsp:Transcript_15623/g.29470  ORF Transcript_15623/g.29470 Transcript_15623/m.29470 type:complete len:108 (+) Transcript_15623:366-689(+)
MKKNPKEQELMMRTNMKRERRKVAAETRDHLTSIRMMMMTNHSVTRIQEGTDRKEDEEEGKDIKVLDIVDPIVPEEDPDPDPDPTRSPFLFTILNLYFDRYVPHTPH